MSEGLDDRYPALRNLDEDRPTATQSEELSGAAWLDSEAVQAGEQSRLWMRLCAGLRFLRDADRALAVYTYRVPGEEVADERAELRKIRRDATKLLATLEASDLGTGALGELGVTGLWNALDCEDVPLGEGGRSRFRRNGRRPLLVTLEATIHLADEILRESLTTGPRRSVRRSQWIHGCTWAYGNHIARVSVRAPQLVSVSGRFRNTDWRDTPQRGDIWDAELLDAELGARGVATVGETGGETADDTPFFLHLTQQEPTAVRGDVPAVEVRLDAAVTKA